MNTGNQLSTQLQQISHSFIEASFYDPTTFYLGDKVIEREEFKRLKKEGLIEVSFQNHIGKRYTLSNKGREYINQA